MKKLFILEWTISAFPSSLHSFLSGKTLGGKVLRSDCGSWSIKPQMIYEWSCRVSQHNSLKLVGQTLAVVWSVGDGSLMVHLTVHGAFPPACQLRAFLRSACCLCLCIPPHSLQELFFLLLCGHPFTSLVCKVDVFTVTLMLMRCQVGKKKLVNCLLCLMVLAGCHRTLLMSSSKEIPGEEQWRIEKISGTIELTQLHFL